MIMDVIETVLGIIVLVACILAMGAVFLFIAAIPFVLWYIFIKLAILPLIVEVIKAIK